MDPITSRRSTAVLSRLFLLALTLSAVVSLAGCGGSSSGGGGGTTTTTTPAVSSINPTKVNAGSAALTLTVNGSGFVSSSVVEVGGTPETTTYVNATQLTATVPATQLTNGAELAVVVANGSTSSTAVDLEVDNPAPTISSSSMTTALAGTASASITFTGTGFMPSTVINVNGSARTTTFINSTQVSAALPSTDFATAGNLAITAVNPTPGGGTSAAVALTVTNPPVGAISLSPSSLAVGSTSPATITVTGAGFIAASTVTMAGTARATTYVNANTLTFTATAADQATAGNLAVTVTNPAPGGGTSTPAYLSITTPTTTPVITSVSPTSIVVGSSSTSIEVIGTGFTTGTTVQWNGTNLPTSYTNYYNGTNYTLALIATVPASDLTATGTASITANTPNANPSTSNAVNLSIVNPPVPTLTSISPAGGPINTASAETLTGTGFTTNTTVAINGQTIPSTFVSSTQITTNFPAYMLATPGNQNVTVTTPAPGGGTSGAQVYTTFISIPNNDIVYNSADGLIYASVPATAAGAIGNAVVGIDPNTGTITRKIQVGTNPNKLALSTDGTQLFVGIDGAATVAQINLSQGKIVDQFSLGGGPGVYNPPYTAAYMAAVPGLPNSVAVATTGEYGSGSAVTIFDSGVARTGSSTTVSEGPLSFGSSASTLYVGPSNVYALTIGSTGITGSTELYSSASNLIWLQYDNGSLYLSNGQVLKAATGALSGTFYTSASSAASGPVVSDSTLDKAFIAESNFSGTAAVYVFDETSFNLLGSIPVGDLGTSGYPTSFRKIVRWGQNGIAAAAVPSSFTSNNQIYIFQSPLVKDVSSAPADLSVSLTAPSTATTGTAISYVAQVTNAGPNAATGATLSVNLDPSLIINSITASQGSCNTATAFSCDLAGLAKGASATVTVNATPTDSGTLAAQVSVSSSSFDPTPSNNQATASTTVTGSLYSPAPTASSISPNLVQAGSAAFTLTVNGTGFNTATTVNLGNTALTTTYVSPTQVTASVSASEIANYGWAPVTVSNPAPGGGASAVIPLTIYNLVNVPANSILFDPYGQSVYATIPSSATDITGNSVVAINPYTGAVGTPVAVGSQPTVMAETTDGDYLYIGLSGANSLAKYNLLTQSLTATIPITVTGNTTSSGDYATWLAAMPGTDDTLAINFPGEGGTFGIFDINGSTGSFRTNFAAIYNGINPVFASPTELYAYDSVTSGAEFYRYSINANGLTLIDGTTLEGLGGYGGEFQFENGLVYGLGGGIINPSTTPPSQVQTLPLIDFYGSGVAGYGDGLASDPSLNKDFLMLENLAGTSAYGLVRYDLSTYLPEAVLEMPVSVSGVDSIWTMQRFGQDGLALLSYNSIGGTAPVVEMMLLRGPFVAPQELSTSTAAVLTSGSASTITHGSGNIMLTLIGSNFLPGVAVTWNGNYRTTNVVSATQVTVAIPASDLSAAGTAKVVATNPGAPASNGLTITIN
jgi:trimeric autotransporter adhesin